MSDGFNEEVFDRIKAAVSAANAPQKVGNSYYAVVPAGYTLQDLTKYIDNDREPNPIRVKASPTFLDPEAFMHYWTAYSGPDSACFAYEPEQVITGILDYHAAGPGEPARWCQHRMTLNMRKSEQWNTWAGANNKRFTQLEFAEFLEQNAIDITEPRPAHMRDVASDLQGSTEVEFGAALRNQDGQTKFRYSETTKTTVGTSELLVPDQFTIFIPPFIGVRPLPMQALLRFRINQGKLTFWYTLIRPEEVLRAAFTVARDKIAADLSITILNGKPGAS